MIIITTYKNMHFQEMHVHISLISGHFHRLTTSVWGNVNEFNKKPVLTLEELLLSKWESWWNIFCWPIFSRLGVEPKIMVKPTKSSILIARVFHDFHHPFWGVKFNPLFLVQHPQIVLLNLQPLKVASSRLRVA